MPPALVCANHPAARAELECKPCRSLLCRDCARTLRDGKTAQCLRCGAMLLPIVAAGAPRVGLSGPVSNAARRVDASRSLVGRLAESWRYLLRPSVLVTLAGLAVLEWLGSFMGLAMRIVVAGLSVGIFFHIVETTANDATDLEPPDFDDVWSNILAPLLRMVTTLVPLFVAWILAGSSLLEGLAGAPFAWTGTAAPATALILAWLVFWPLLILVAAISRSIVATVNPKVWIDVVKQMGADYFIAAVAFYAVLLVELFLLTPLVWRVEAKIHVPVVTSLVAEFILLLPMAWRGRILGEAARPYLD